MGETQERKSVVEQPPPWPKQGPASYFPAIEKKYGRSIAQWQKIISDSGLDKHMVIVGRLKTDDMFEQNAFAAAAWPHDDENFTRLHLEIYALEHFIGAKVFAQAAHLEADTRIIVCGVVYHFNRRRVSR